MNGVGKMYLITSGGRWKGMARGSDETVLFHTRGLNFRLKVRRCLVGGLCVSRSGMLASWWHRHRGQRGVID